MFSVFGLQNIAAAAATAVGVSVARYINSFDDNMTNIHSHVLVANM